MNQITQSFRKAICLLAIAGAVHAADKPNILFIAVDDLRPELGCYGSPVAITPNLDKLAGDGLLFKRAYCQEAICRPSRASLMTGARPDTTGLTHNYVALRELRPDILTLPQHFIAHGYETVYLGKVFHPGDTDDENSWSRKPVNGIPGIAKPVGGYALPENQAIQRENMQRMLAKYGEAARLGLGSGPAYESADVPDHAYIDGYNTVLAIAAMKEMAERGDKPFFLALGFMKPHLNWVAPKKYWDLYDPAELPLAERSEGPEKGAAMGLHASFELRTRHGIPKNGPIEPELALPLMEELLTDECAATRCVAASAISKITGNPLTEISVAVDLLHAEDWLDRYVAAEHLGGLGAVAAPALPELRRILNDPSRAVSTMAEQAIAAIEID